MATEEAKVKYHRYHPLSPGVIVAARFPVPCLVIVPFVGLKLTNGSKYDPVANWTKGLVPLLK